MRIALTLLLMITAQMPAQQKPAVTINKLGDTYEFKVGADVVTRYHARGNFSKPFLWPLNAPGGIGLTRDWPIKSDTPGESKDHPHQRSAWFGFGEIIPTGVSGIATSIGTKGIDFWTEGLNHGKIDCSQVDISQAATGKLQARNYWKTADGRPVIDEIRDITLMTLENAYLITVRVRLKPHFGTQFGDSKEGAFAVRVTDRLSAHNNPTSEITLSTGGRGEGECWGRKADWCSYSGEIDGKRCGIAIFDDPTNRYRACWHVRSYGLMAANPFGRVRSGFPAHKDGTDSIVQIKAGDELMLRYGILLFTGNVNVREYFRQFSAQ